MYYPPPNKPPPSAAAGSEQQQQQSYSAYAPPPPPRGYPAALAAGPPPLPPQSLPPQRAGYAAPAVGPPPLALPSSAMQKRAGPLNIETQPSPRPGVTRNESFETSPSIERAPSSGGLRRVTSRIDPQQMPRPDRPQVDLVFQTRSATQRRQPPVANSVFSVVDNGNASPRFVRCTTVAVPASGELVKETGLPLALHVTPFAVIEDGDDALCEVDFSLSHAPHNYSHDAKSAPVSLTPPRCVRCHAYINALVSWSDGGKKWSCSLCEQINHTPEWYQCPLDNAGLRADRLQRPELCRGSVDYIVGEDYCEKPVEGLLHLFLIELNERSLGGGVVTAALRAVQCAVDSLCETQREKRAALAAQRERERETHSAWRTHTPHNALSQRADEEPLSVRVCVVCVLRASLLFFHTTPSHNTQDGEYTVSVVCARCEDALCPLPFLSLTHDAERERETLRALLSRLSELSPSLCERETERERETAADSHTLRESERERELSLTRALCCVGALCDGTHTHAHLFLSPSLSLAPPLLSLYGTPEEVQLYGERERRAMCEKDGQFAAALLAVEAKEKEKETKISPSPGSAKLNTKSASSTTDSSVETLSSVVDECLRACVSVSVSAFTERERDGESDLALWGSICRYTGGTLSLFPRDVAREDSAQRVCEQVLSEIRSFAAYDLQAKVRISPSISVESVQSVGLFQRISEELRVPLTTTRDTMTFYLQHTSPGLLWSKRGLADEERVVLQFAVLYTSCRSLTRRAARRVRVHTLALYASDKSATVIRHCDSESVVCAWVKRSLSLSMSAPLDLADNERGPHASLKHSASQCLLRYRRLCSAHSPRGQLVLPESLKVLPIYMLGALKHTSLLINSPSTSEQGVLSISTNSTLSPRPATGRRGEPLIPLASASERIVDRERLLRAPLSEIINTLYPRLFSIFELLDSDALTDAPISPIQSSLTTSSFYHPNAPHNPPTHTPSPTHTQNSPLSLCETHSLRAADRVLLTHTLPCTSEVCDSERLYAVHDGVCVWLYVGRNVPYDLLEELFLFPHSAHTQQQHAAVSYTQRTLNALSPLSRSFSLDRPPTLSVREDTVLGAKLSAFLKILRADCSIVPEIRVVWAELHSHNPHMAQFCTRLVEDSQPGMPSYVDFLCAMHAQIQKMP